VPIVRFPFHGNNQSRGSGDTVDGTRL